MAPAPRKSEDEIDKLAEPRAPPHIILRTLPSLSFATPTHLVRVQLSFQSPTPHKSLAMSGQTAVDVQLGLDPRNSFGRAPQAYNASEPPPPTRLDLMERRMATKDDNQRLAKSLIDEMDQRAAETDTNIAAISTAFDEFKKDTFVQFEEKTEKAFLRHTRQNVNLEVQIVSLKGDVERLSDGLEKVDKDLKDGFATVETHFQEVGKKFQEVNDRLDELVALISRMPGLASPMPPPVTSAPFSVPSIITTPLPRNRGSPVTFDNPHDSDTSSLPDSLLDPPLEPPSPSGLSPSSLMPPSPRHRLSRSSLSKSMQNLRKGFRGVLSKIRNAERDMEGTMQDLDAMTQMLGAGQQQDDALLHSPQEYESPVAGPSTPTETQTASKGKSKLKLGQPIQRDRQ